LTGRAVEFSERPLMLYRRSTRRRFLRHCLWGVPAACVTDAFGVEPGWLEVRTLRVGQGAVRHRFVHFTDLHFKGDEAYLTKVVGCINALKPDFVCFTGDLIEQKEFLAPTLKILHQVRAPVYGIPGNHDWWSGADFQPIREAFASTGGAWLQDQQLPIADGSIHLMGMDRFPLRVEAEPGKFNLLMVHYPAWVDRLDDFKVDLILAGHSHGGQVRLPFYGALFTPSETDGYELGWFETPHGPMYVNPGIGTFYLDVRFNCRPELTVFEIAR
jgi:predicted MPP superfamily phosphohydrolase